MDMLSVCVVVVTYNRKDLLSKCISALLNQSYPLQEIIIVDNNSNDGTEEMLRASNEIVYIRLPVNLGGSYGFYKGIQIALAERHNYVWVMDDDSIPEESALEELMKHKEHYRVLCSSVLTVDGKFDLVHRRRVDLTKIKESVIESGEYRKGILDIDLFSFVGTLFEVDVIKQVGLPRSDFFFQYDDTELSLRIRRNNIRIGLVPCSRILHIGSPSYPAAILPYNSKRHFYSIRNRTYVYSLYNKNRIFFLWFLVLELFKSLARLSRRSELNWSTFKVTTLAYMRGLRGDLSAL